jgi:oligopeptide transport system permease protein
MSGLLTALAMGLVLLGLFLLSNRYEKRGGSRSLASFFLRRFAWLILTVLVVFSITFFLMRAVPGGPFDEERRLLPEVRRNLEARFGLDKPLFEQYLNALAGLPTLDFGPCLSQRDWSVRQVILQGLPPSLLLGAAAMLWALLIGLPAGMGAAKARGTWIDSLLTTLSSLGMAIPNFVLAGLLLLLLVFHFRVFSPAGLLTPADLILPSFTLGVPFAAQVARLFRTGMLDVLGQDWIRTAHAKGLSPRRVLLTQALLPASIPVRPR